VDPGKVSAWLADLRRPGRINEIPPGDAFTSSDVGKLLGIGTDAVRRFVARHRLPTVGNGPARRLPRTTVQAIAERAAKGNGPTTSHDTADVAATVTGDAVRLMLLLWRRISLEDVDVQVDGDAGAARRVLGRPLSP